MFDLFDCRFKQVEALASSYKISSESTPFCLSPFRGVTSVLSSRFHRAIPMKDIESSAPADRNQQHNAEGGISTALIEANASVLTKAMMTRVLDLEMRCNTADARILHLEQSWSKTKNVLQHLRPEYTTSWRKIGSNEVDTDPEVGVFQLSNDLYSVLATAKWTSRPFWFSLLVIFGFQFTLLCLLGFYQADLYNTKTARTVDNPLNVPPNVEAPVRWAQALILVVALFSQSDLLGGVENLSLGMPASYRGAPRFYNMNSIQWRLASIVRICQGLIYVGCAFILCVQSETVFDVLLNVLGLGFVSDLDDLVFRLGMLGYFGGGMKNITIDIKHGDFVRQKIDDKGCFVRFLKKSLHRIVTYACLAIVLIMFYILSRDQIEGRYTVKNILVEINDDSVGGLSSALSGSYVAMERDLFNRRLKYVQDTAGRRSGQIMYCDEREDGRGGWVLLVTEDGSPGSVDPCLDFTFTSESTLSYDVLTIGDWYSSLCEETTVDTLNIKEAYDCSDGQILESDRGFSNGQSDGLSDTPTNGQSDGLSDTPTNGQSDGLSDTPTNGQSDNPAGSPSNGQSDNPASSPSNGQSDNPAISPSDGQSDIPAGSPSIGQTDSPASSPSNGQSDNPDISPSDGQSDNPAGSPSIGQTDSPAGSPSNGQSDGQSDSPAGSPVDTPSNGQSGGQSNSPVDSPVDSPADSPVDSPVNSPVSCNAGYYNSLTGKCECQYNETGDFCETPPSKNGICDVFFNDAMTDYDGGDCCGATCTLPNCGVGGVETLFGMDIESLYYTEISTEEIIGFQKCRDDQMTPILLELVPIPGVADVCVPSLTVQCDGEGSIFLRTPLVCTADLQDLEREIIMVPPGATCSLTIGNAALTSGIARIQLLQAVGEDSGTNSLLLLETPVFDEVLEWSVP
ncbi:unnamed protein product [Cylindrotheca closterium]|uniref:Uncharacterized protein n=1 Tax=Cylindrotheca closterium TaxID=2856 RepID=A0AAD2FZP4_9STRA|nr:unnamed protein product [Cylindrotheca closterium]